METFENLVRAEFAPKNVYLNTASNGLLPARTVAALDRAARMRADGVPLGSLYEDVEAVRASFARLAGVPVERIALGGSVAEYGALIAASLPEGAEVLTAEADFASLVNPFHMRGDLKVRAVPLERLAESVRPDTALVAVSSAQSADGRLADLAAVRRVLADPEAYADDVRADEREAAQLGATGVPFFVLDRTYGVSGAQPAEVFTQALTQAWGDRSPLTLLDTGDADACGPDGCAVPQA